MKLKTPSAPFSPVPIRGESITVDIEGKILVLPTGNPNILTNFNEYTLSDGRMLPNPNTYFAEKYFQDCHFPELYFAYIQTHRFSDTHDSQFGIKNLIKPWIALYDPEKTTVDFFLFTHKPKKLDFTVNDDNEISCLHLYPGNGLIYHGQITYPDLTAPAYHNDFFSANHFDSLYFSDSYFSEHTLSKIPKIFDVLTEGSVSKFLLCYGMVI